MNKQPLISSSQKVKELALAVLDTEINAINRLRQQINDQFIQACQYMLECQGRIVVTGMGKSGHIGSKIAATLASTGSPAFFLHPGEASHGDLGMLKRTDVVLALSYSGETDEIITLLPVIKRYAVPLIAITGNSRSTLAQAASIHLEASIEKEACPLNLAPTASTTAALVLGDALAIALLEARGFTEEDFALSHPGGSLGKRLLLRASDIMSTGAAIPVVSDTATISEALVEITSKSLGMTAIINKNQQLIGIFTDGDLRRTIDREIPLKTTVITEAMTHNPASIKPNMLAFELLHLMEEKKINGVFVLDEDQHILGVINMHTLLQAGVL